MLTLFICYVIFSTIIIGNCLFNIEELNTEVKDISNDIITRHHMLSKRVNNKRYDFMDDIRNVRYELYITKFKTLDDFKQKLICLRKINSLGMKGVRLTESLENDYITFVLSRDDKVIYTISK